MEIWQTVLVAIIQGLTEFLPISSSAHIQLPSLLLGWQDQGLLFDVAIHAGTLVAVVLYFRQTLIGMVVGTLDALRTRRVNSECNLILGLAIATVPIVVVGLFALDYMETFTRNLDVIVVSTLVFGVLLGVADWYAKRTTYRNELEPSKSPTLLTALWIGCAQILALIPGTSRSGITITCALFLGLTRTDAARFSFLLAIPVIAAAFVLTLVDAISIAQEVDVGSLTIGFLVAAMTAYVCIDLFLRTLEKIGLMPFVIYRLAVGLLLGIYIWL